MGRKETGSARPQTRRSQCCRHSLRGGAATRGWPDLLMSPQQLRRLSPLMLAPNGRHGTPAEAWHAAQLQLIGTVWCTCLGGRQRPACQRKGGTPQPHDDHCRQRSSAGMPSTVGLGPLARGPDCTPQERRACIVRTCSCWQTMDTDRRRQLPVRDLRDGRGVTQLRIVCGMYPCRTHLHTLDPVWDCACCRRCCLCS